MNAVQNILNTECFLELPDKLEAFLAQADLTQSSMTQLYKALEQSCSQSLMDAFLSGHPKWCIFSKSKAIHVFLCRKWKKSRSLKENRERLKKIANEIRNEYIPSDGSHISYDSAEKILKLLDGEYNFSNIIFLNQPLLILLPDCGHRVYDAFCRPYTFTNGSNACDIFMLHATKDTKTSSECMLLHELGHVLNVSRTGDIEVPPTSFQKFNELILAPEDCQAVMQEATEMYANIFAIAVLTATELNEFDRYKFIPDETRSLMKKYIEYELSSCGSCQ